MNIIINVQVHLRELQHHIEFLTNICEDFTKTKTIATVVCNINNTQGVILLQQTVLIFNKVTKEDV